MKRSTQRVLVVDDDACLREIHADRLQHFGFREVECMDSGRAAVDKVRGGSAYDLVFLDLCMPGMDGIEVIRHFADAHFAGCLILMSGEDERLLQSAERLIAAHGLRSAGHLCKPFSDAAVAAILDSLAERTPSPQHAKEMALYDADEIRLALLRGEFFNHYQPQVSMATGEVVGLETLVRWQHPKHGLVGPGDFLERVNQVGLINALTRAVFRRAVTDFAAMPESRSSCRLAINVTASNLECEDFTDFVVHSVAQAGLFPHQVVLEVTENELISNPCVALDVLTRLRLMRFNLSIDDFGTGYSTFTQLNAIPFDELKIDQQFVRNAWREPVTAAIYGASLELARRLRMTTVAEGIEAREDWDFVRASGTDAGQGYFIGRPMPAEALPEWRLDWSRRFAAENQPATDGSVRPRAAHPATL